MKFSRKSRKIDKYFSAFSAQCCSWIMKLSVANLNFTYSKKNTKNKPGAGPHFPYIAHYNNTHLLKKKMKAFLSLRKNLDIYTIHITSKNTHLAFWLLRTNIHFFIHANFSCRLYDGPEDRLKTFTFIWPIKALL